jgi:hypothetical protein
MHQEAVCLVDLKFKRVIDPVVHYISKIRARILQCRESQVLFNPLNSKIVKIIYNNSVRSRSSKGNVFACFFQLKYNCLNYLTQKRELLVECEFMKNGTWLCNLAFLLNVTNYPNILNTTFE